MLDVGSPQWSGVTQGQWSVEDDVCICLGTGTYWVMGMIQGIGTRFRIAYKDANMTLVTLLLVELLHTR